MLAKGRLRHEANLVVNEGIHAYKTCNCRQCTRGLNADSRMRSEQKDHRPSDEGSRNDDREYEPTYGRCPEVLRMIQLVGQAQQ